MGPLALLADMAGIEVAGTDVKEGPIAEELRKAEIYYEIGEQDGKLLKGYVEGRPFEEVWYIHSAAVPKASKEYQMAKDLELKIGKRDELINYLVNKKYMQMVAVAGTHGKTTTTGMLVWACKRLKLPVAWLAGTTLGFAPSGYIDRDSKYFIYEADEYDRNFLKYRPWVGVITNVSYDHPDTYKSVRAYESAFAEFRHNCTQIVESAPKRSKIKLSGAQRRKDAELAVAAMQWILLHEAGFLEKPITTEDVIDVLNQFPGVGRRFERIAAGVYSDYAHHPEEIEATLEMAQEEAKRYKFKGVVAVYEPHQNARQHAVREQYREAFKNADRLFWLPTYLTREKKPLPVIQPEEFIKDLTGVKAEPAKLGADLEKKLKKLRGEGYLILLMTAGPADEWFREVFDDIIRL